MLTLFFLFFKLALLINAVGVILSKNPVHSVLFLVLVFINAAFLLIFLEADFMALILIVVYVGAIAILFLFICMMLNIKTEQFNKNIFAYLPISGVFVILLIFEVSLIIYNFFAHDLFSGSENIILLFTNASNIFVLGETLYTFYALNFLLAGFILLIAMVGAIFLTLHHRLDVRRQVIFQQIDRTSILQKLK